jgi:hypothetical protein
MPLNFTDLDSERDRIQDVHPGWQVWYVPHMNGITWCARPLPSLSEGSTDDLEKAIRETEQEWKESGALWMESMTSISAGS